MEVKEGAHHLDLMWAEEEDTKSVRDVREIERAHIERWIKDGAGLGLESQDVKLAPA